MRALLVVLVLVVLPLVELGCSSLGPYPSCGDVYRLRPEEFGHVFCHMPASAERQAASTAAAIERNDQRRIIRAAILDAARAERAGANP